MFKKFIEDERGISEEVFKLAMIVVVVAAVLAILASILSSVWESSDTAVDTTGEAMETLADQALCEAEGTC